MTHRQHDSGSVTPQTVVNHPHLENTNALRTVLAEDHYPDDLLVYDSSARTGRATRHPIHYARLYPVLLRDSSGFPNGKRGRMPKYFSTSLRNVAHLYLDSAELLDSGSRSVVYRAPVTLPPRKSQQSASVVAKLAHATCGAHQYLLEEAALFDNISRAYPLDDADTSAEEFPKFYGCYLPVRKDGSIRVRSHGEECDEGCEREVLWASPIVLLEQREDTAVAE
ncbi:hypothetical protein C8Q80DRAFT_464034 [Daedaleopsis nitida]|nr:hypothetical protein C8Q80DRAFT_464034 [Daedaleopsis nitida]